VNVGTFQPSAEQAAAMTEAEDEAGIDIADVLNVRALEVRDSTPDEIAATPPPPDSPEPFDATP
jgi:hypothetical protein